MLTRIFTAAITGVLLSTVSCYGATVTFKNVTTGTLQLHLRNGPVSKNPDDRGSQNTTMKKGDVYPDDVGDGDVWYCYGNKQVNDDDNPPLCNAKGGDSVDLDKSHECFVDN